MPSNKMMHRRLRKLRATKEPARRKPRKRHAPKQAIMVAPPRERPWQLNSEEITIVKNSIAKGASDDELRYCLTVARRYRLDPFKQQIWFIHRWDSNADNGKGGVGAKVWVPQVGIYGMMHIAARDHKDYGTFSEPEYGPMMEMNVEGTKFKAPEWCRVKAWKKGIEHPTIGEAYFEEYCPRSAKNILFWKTYPHRMIAKCAKAQAIRETYPDLGGLYIPEEMDKSGDDYTPQGRLIVTAEGTTPSGLPVAYQPHSDTPQLTPAQKKIVEEKMAAFKEKAKPAEPEREVRETVQLFCENGWGYLSGNGLQIILPYLKSACKAEYANNLAWRVPIDTLELVAEACKTMSISFVEVSGTLTNEAPPMPDAHAKPEPAKKNGSEATPLPAPVAGVISAIEEKTTTKKKIPVMSLCIGGKWVSCFDKNLWPFLREGKGLDAEVIFSENGRNIVGLKRIGKRNFTEGKIPEIDVNEPRPTDTKSLFT